MVVPAAIMGQQQSARIVEHLAHALDRAGPSADIQDPLGRQSSRLGLRAVFPLERGQLAFRRVGSCFGGADPGVTGLRDLGCLCGALLQALAPGCLAMEAGLQVVHQMPHAGQAILARRMRVFLDPTGRERTKAANRLVAGGDLLLQPGLLALHLVPQRRVLVLERGQPTDIRPVRSANQMRQHMHVAERPTNPAQPHIRMRQHSPIRTRDIARLAMLRPAMNGRRLALKLGKSLDDDLVALIERLVQQFRCRRVAVTEPDRLRVQVVIAHAGDILADRPAHDPAQLARREAGADDRAVNRLAQIPQFGALRLRRPERFVGDGELAIGWADRISPPQEHRRMGRRTHGSATMPFMALLPRCISSDMTPGVSGSPEARPEPSCFEHDVLVRLWC